MARSTNKPIELTKEMLKPFFGTPLRNAAILMGLCPTALKSVCRKLGIKRWPYQQSRRKEVGRCAGEDTEQQFDGVMSSSSSVSCATTMTGEQSSSSASDHTTTTNDQAASPQSQSIDMSSDVGIDDYAMFGEGDIYDGRESQAYKSHGDGPACLSSLMQKQQEVGEHQPGVIQYMPSHHHNTSRRVQENYATPHSHMHMQSAYMGVTYPYYAHYLPSQRPAAQPMPHSHAMYAQHSASASRDMTRGGASALPTSRVTAQHEAQSYTTLHISHTARPASPQPLDMSHDIEAKVELSHAAHDLEMDECSALMYHIAKQRDQSKLPPYSAAPAFHVDDEESGLSVCDMAWLSPC